MAELKLKDFVDEKSMKELEELDKTLDSIRTAYSDASKELAKGLSMEIKVKGDADKLQALLNAQSKNVASATTDLNNAMKKQAEVAEHLMQRIEEKASRERLSAKQAKELAKAQSEVSKSMQQAAKAEAALAKAQKAANSSKKAANLTEEERKKIIKEAIALTNQEVHSIEEANQANKRLRQAVKLLRDTDEDYANTLGRLNSTIGVNTDYVRRNSDRYTQQKMTIGDYKEQIKQAWYEINRGNGAMRNMGIIANNVGGIMRTRFRSGLNQVTDGVGNMIKGFVGAQAILRGFTALIGKFKEGVRAIVSFEAENSKLAAILGTTSKKIKELTTDARRLGATTKYTASQVTELQIELAKLGFTRKDILQMTEAVLKFAQATGAELGEAAALAGASLRMFNATTKESERYVSAMAVATSKSALSFSYLATALPIVGPVAKSFNFTIEDTLALLGKLADSGFDASMAATATRNIFLNLADSSGKLARALGRPVTNIDELVEGLKSLKEKGVDLNTTLQLTDKRSVAAFNAFLTAADGISVLRKQVTGVEDELHNMADTMADNVQGAIFGLSSAWEAFMLSFYNSKGTIKEVIDFLTKGIRYAADQLKGPDQKQSEADNKATNTAQKELASSDYLEKHKKNLEKLYNGYVESGMNPKEAQKKAKDEYIEGLQSRLKEENEAYETAIDQRKKLEKELDDRSFFKVLTSWRRTNNDIKDEIDTTIKAAAGKKALASVTESVIEDLGKMDMTTPAPGSGIGMETDDAKKKRLKAESDLRASQIALMDKGFEKEVKTIKAGYQKRIDAIEGATETEKALKLSYQKEMDKAVADYTDKYNKDRYKLDLENRLAATKEGSEEEMAIRLALLDTQREEEMEKAKETGANLLDIENKYLVESQSIREEYAALKAEKIAEEGAVTQLLLNTAYHQEQKMLAESYSKGEISREEYERRKAEIADQYAVETARNAVASIEKQLEVEELSAEEREKIVENLQKSKADLANAEADAEIAAMQRVMDKEQEDADHRARIREMAVRVGMESLQTMADFANMISAHKMKDLEKEQEANQEAHDADLERIAALEEQGVITKEEAEIRKRAAEDRTAKKNEEIEKKKVELKKKQAKWDKSVQIAQTAIATARGIMEAWQLGPIAGAIFASVIGAMGAVQVATIAATPIPAYAKGTKEGGHQGGLALVGDGGKQEVVMYNGQSWITPDSPTLINLPKGAEVFPDVEKMNWEDVNLSLNPLGKGDSPVIINDYSALSKEVKGMKTELKNELRRIAAMQHRDNYNMKFQQYKYSNL